MDPSHHPQDIHNFPLETFVLAPARDTPWFLPAAILPHHPSSSSSPSNASLLAQASGFTNFRDPQPASESDTHRDSGYGSNGPTLPGNAPSVEGDGQPDARLGLFDSGIGQLHLMLEQGPVASLPFDARFYCHFCKRDVNTKAQLNKHIQRHEKPHTCPYTTCKRSRPGCGFGTLNDLQRHRRCVHKELDGGALYVCPYEPCTQKKDQKRWPRGDNFRSHLIRQHPQLYREDDDLQNYLYREPEGRPEPSHLQQQQHLGRGLGSHIGSIDTSFFPGFCAPLNDHALPDAGSLTLAPQFPQEPAAPAPASLSGQATLASEWSPPAPSDVIAPDIQSQCFSDHTLIDVFNGQLPYSMPDLSLDGDFSTETFPDMFDGPAEALDDVAEEEASAAVDYLVQDMGREDGAWAVQERLGNATQCVIDDFNLALAEDDKASHEPLHDGSLTDVLARTLIEARSDPSRLIEILKQLPPQLLESALKRDQALDGKDDREDGSEMDRKDEMREDASLKGFYQCPDCTKTFHRRCELKKHSKRHAKPYGCTFQKCTKSFGSKNDWKRHESNQHEVLEKWTCDMPDCRKVRYRRETFKIHLHTDHDLAGQPRLVEEKLERCRMGRHCDPRFWCGFCVSVVEIMEANVNTWTRRCDHIDNHLFGKGGLAKRTMRDWAFLEEEELVDEEGEEEEELEDADDGDGEPEPESEPALAAEKQGKRKAEEALERPRQKRSKESTLMWYCCNCSTATGSVFKVSSSCIDCSHRKCPHCAEEMVTSVDEECNAM